MDKRYSVNPEHFKRMTTEEMRREFLITDLFKADALAFVYSHVDRMVTLGCMPVKETVSIFRAARTSPLRLADVSVKMQNIASASIQSCVQY